jgi:TolA-binding protein
MISRNLVVGSACLVCLVFGGFAISQDRTTVARGELASEKISTNLEHRVVELERQIKSLNQEIESLRKEIHPSATRSTRPKPMSKNVQSREDQ